MDTIKLWTSDYGQTIRARTYASDIGSATSVLRWKKIAAATTATITGSVVVGDTDDDGDSCYSVDYVVASGFLTDKAGKWICQTQASYSNGIVTSEDAFYVTVAARPTA
jgi:hypothetical protein